LLTVADSFSVRGSALVHLAPPSAAHADVGGASAFVEIRCAVNAALRIESDARLFAASARPTEHSHLADIGVVAISADSHVDESAGSERLVLTLRRMDGRAYDARKRRQAMLNVRDAFATQACVELRCGLLGKEGCGAFWDRPAVVDV
jgi:hypothetical protein